jgi:hypothetical protein
MRRTPLVTIAVGMVVMLCAAGAWAYAPDATEETHGSLMERPVAAPRPETNGARLETLWIFDADYSTTTGDNDWTGTDRSGIMEQDNYWHHDTIRLDGHTELGDSTWWCGTYNTCWRQDRGYGNSWLQVLERHFTEVASADAGSYVTLEWDQRFAMEKDYDYGYVDVRSSATSDTWYTVSTYTNFGFAGTPGLPTAWGMSGTPDQTVDLSPYVVDGSGGMEFDLRFRFEADGAYSSEDQYNNAQNSVKDGAWQLDNIVLKDDATPVFTDDAESYGKNGWVTDPYPASGQTGVYFWRGQFGIDFITGRAFTCESRPVGTWMWVACNPVDSKMISDQFTWMMSPPIDVSGAEKLVGQWDMWLDMPQTSGDGFDLFLASDDRRECVTDPGGFLDEDVGWWYGGPFWGNWIDDWDAFAGNDWLAIVWDVRQRIDPVGEHMGGIFVNRTKVGIPSGDAGTQFNRDTWSRYNDWFVEQMADALADTGRIEVSDDDGIAEVLVIATNDGGTTWESYACAKEDPEEPESNWWLTPPPVNQMEPGAEIYYYYSATDTLGNTALYPEGAPTDLYEFSILPISATVSEPGMLLVDKHGRRMPGEDRNYNHTSEYYYKEMLTILGYDYEVYDVEVPSGTNEQSHGPDTMGYKYYDTQLWIFNEFNSYTAERFDQRNLIDWLNESGEGKERNLLFTGNDVGYELMDAGTETLGFYETWLATSYLDDAVGSVLTDSCPTVRDHAGGNDFMTYDDGSCMLMGGCPSLNFFDVIEPRAGVVGAETVVDYIKADTSVRPAGVAYTHSTLGYQTVNLGFGMEFMMDSSLPSGYYQTGIWDRQDFMQNILDYFGKTPDGPGTGVVDGGLKNALSHAYPNPFNPVTKIAYSVKEAGPVSIEVYNVAGKVVRSLLSEELEAGASGYVVWDGRGDDGEKCASGVYFYRIAAPGFSESHKMVMLK